MSTANTTFQTSLSKLLIEVFNGPPGAEAFILNPGDPGLLGQLDSLDAAAASARPMPGKTTIASHVDHVRFGLSLLNRWASGDANAFATADWEASWRKTSLTPDEWQTLRDALGKEAAAWQRAVTVRDAWDDLAAAGAISSLAHTAYHLGAIRQILAAQGR